MYEFHSRQTTLPRQAHASSIPASQTKALDRRHTLDAQQRTFREPATTRDHATLGRHRPA
jgi:hypothetical protein